MSEYKKAANKFYELSGSGDEIRELELIKISYLNQIAESLEGINVRMNILAETALRRRKDELQRRRSELIEQRTKLFRDRAESRH